MEEESDIFFFLSGCCRDRCCFLLYVIFLVIFIIVQLVVFIQILSRSSHYWEMFRTMFTEALHHKYRGAHPSGEHKNVYSFVFDALNMALRCCGINNVTDYEKTNGEWKVNKLQEIGFDFLLPPTCCRSVGLRDIDGRRNRNLQLTCGLFISA